MCAARTYFDARFALHHLSSLFPIEVYVHKLTHQLLHSSLSLSLPPPPPPSPPPPLPLSFPPPPPPSSSLSPAHSSAHNQWLQEDGVALARQLPTSSPILAAQ